MRKCVRICICILLSAFLAALFGCAQQPREDVLEVAAFQGGFGLDFFQKKAQEFEKKYPQLLTPPGSKKPLKIEVWGSPRIWEQLRPRFVSGDVPDLAYPGWGMDYWKLVAEHQVAPMDKYLAEPAWDQKMTWGQTFDKRLLDRGAYKGHYYIMPQGNSLNGWWYDAALFAKHGWQPPATYPQLIALCEQIKKAGIAPMTYQGKYPDYVMRGLFIPWVISIGGIKAFYDAENLKPGAWNSPAFLKSAQLIAELRAKGDFAAGALGKTHTQAQADFVAGKAALIPCGTWLSSEQKDDFQTHPNFKLHFLMPPIIPGGQGDPAAIGCGTEDWIIPAKARHPKMAAEFFKFLTNLQNSKEWVREKHTFTAIQGSDDVSLTPDLAEASQAYRRAKTVWVVQYSQWYPQMRDTNEDAMRRLLSGDITPKQCVDMMEQAAAKVRIDKSIPKHTVTR